MKEFITRIVDFWNATLPARVLKRFNDSHGSVLASGMSFSAIFSVFAAIWIGIGVFGFVLAGNTQFWETTLTMLNTWVPGLFDLGEGGAINPDDLRPSVTVLSWTGAIAIVTLLFTAMGWLEATRSSLYAVMKLPESNRNVLLTKVIDLGLMLGFGILVLLTAASAVMANTAANWLSELFADGNDQALFSEASIRIIGFSINFIFNIVVLLMLFKVLASLNLKLREFWVQLLVGALALTGMQSLGSLLLGGAGRNPLLATFAVLIGLLLWFNLVSRIMLLIAAWIAVAKEEELARVSSRR